MDFTDLNPPPSRIQHDPQPLTLLEAIPEFAINEPSPPDRNVWLPVVLFCITCLTTLFAGSYFLDHSSAGWRPALTDGLMYSAAVMTILLCHEMGHFLQALRHNVNASLPYFIPMPLTPIGTFGAVIRMEPHRGDRRAIFDIGISGPLAGLAQTVLFLWLGLYQHYRPITPKNVYGSPLLVEMLWSLTHSPLPKGFMIDYHPVAFAGWVGLLITSINLIPIGQLDGGHILYGMFRKRANVASVAILAFAITVSIAVPLTGWWLMLGLITILGTRHPPTANDFVPLGAGRYILGFLTLAFLLIGFTPVPISPGQ